MLEPASAWCACPTFSACLELPPSPLTRPTLSTRSLPTHLHHLRPSSSRLIGNPRLTLLRERYCCGSESQVYKSPRAFLQAEPHFAPHMDTVRPTQSSRLISPICIRPDASRDAGGGRAGSLHRMAVFPLVCAQPFRSHRNLWHALAVPARSLARPLQADKCFALVRCRRRVSRSPQKNPSRPGGTLQ